MKTALSQGTDLSIEEAATEAIAKCGGEGVPMSKWQSLTPTERQVAALVAEGLTNPEIAERLFITRATVKTSSGPYLSKLGISRRSELGRELWGCPSALAESHAPDG